MALYCLLMFVTGTGWVIVAPISISIAKAYHISDQLVSLLPLSYMLLYPFANFPSNWLIDIKGLRIGILVGATGTFLGAALRCLVSYDFMFVIAGQVVCALVQVVVLNAPTTIAVRWFLPESVLMIYIEVEITGVVYSVSIWDARFNYWSNSAAYFCQSEQQRGEYQGRFCKFATMSIRYLLCSLSRHTLLFQRRSTHTCQSDL